jgi:hypothetical protein
MTAERFNTLTLPQQCYYTVKCGIYLASFNDCHFSLDLYQVNNYYVEVFYRLGETECSFARAFSDTFDLNKYLQKISIAELLEKG